MKPLVWGIFSFLFAARALAGEVVYTVDCRGGGDFRTVQECFEALPSKPDGWRTVRILPGTYREKVTLCAASLAGSPLYGSLVWISECMNGHALRP